MAVWKKKEILLWTYTFDVSAAFRNVMCATMCLLKPSTRKLTSGIVENFKKWRNMLYPGGKD